MTDERFDPETTHSIEAIAAEFTRIIESRNAALEAARAELSSETRWAKQYHDEAEQLREPVTLNADQVTQLAHENAMLRAEIELLREDVAAQKR